MEKKIVLEELIRMRELMGMKVLSETRNKLSRNLLLEISKTVDEFLPLSPRSIDNLTKTVGNYTDNLSKLSDEFANRGITTMDDLAKVVGEKQGMVADDVTDDMIKAYIKNDQALYSSILKRASDAAAEKVKVLLKNVDLKSVFKDESQLNKYLTIMSTPIGPRTADEISNQLNQSIDELEGAIKTIKSKGQTVPNDLLELLENFYGKKIDLSNYKSKTTSSPMVKSVDNVVSGGKSEMLKVLDELEESEGKTLLTNIVNKATDEEIKFANDIASKIPKGSEEELISTIKNKFCSVKESNGNFQDGCSKVTAFLKIFDPKGGRPVRAVIAILITIAVTTMGVVALYDLIGGFFNWRESGYDVNPYNDDSEDKVKNTL